MDGRGATYLSICKERLLNIRAITSHEKRHGKQEKSRRRVLLLLTLGAVIVAGCVHFRTVSTDIAPTVTTPQKYPAKTAVYFAPRLVNCEVAKKPDTMYGGSHEYRYRWGPSLQATLTKCVQSAYADVTVVKEMPGPGEFQRVIAFDVPKMDLLVEFVPGYLRQEAKAKAAIFLTMEIFDGKTMESLRTLPVSGRGSSSEDASGFTPYASKHFTLAMEKALQELSEIVSNLLITGGAEPRGVTGTGLPSNK
jgi:hypothetical protein